MKVKTTAIIVALSIMSACCLGLAQVPPPDQKEEIALTVYNGGYGVVRETRKLTVDKDGFAKFIDVPTAIDATTVHFKSLTDPQAVLLEQNYQYDLVSADKLLQKYIDKPLDVVVKDKDKAYSGTLMSFDGNQLVLKEDTGNLVMIQRADNVRDIRFKSLPEGLLTKPTLLWQIGGGKAGEQTAEVSYQTGGLNWHAEYVMVLGADDTTADLSGWVSVQNNSGKTYKQAKLKFIAGDVRKIVEQQADLRMAAPAAPRGMAGTAAPMQEKAFFEYHMYSLPLPSTVADNEVKQLEMFSPVAGLKVEKKYLYAPAMQFRWYGGQYTDPSYGVTSDKKVNIFVEFKNEKANKLGIPLPAGKVRVYKRDEADKAMEFIGEEKIDHTPMDEKLSLQIGNAFDVVGERKQTSFKVETSRKMMWESMEIKLRNHKEQDITVRLKEPMYRWSSWEITAKSQDYNKDEGDARTVIFDVPVKAKGETVVTYTVQYSW